MARAVYPHELQDPDFSWLLSRFHESNPQYLLVESSSMPLVLVKVDTPRAEAMAMPFPPALSEAEEPVTQPGEDVDQ